MTLETRTHAVHGSQEPRVTVPSGCERNRLDGTVSSSDWCNSFARLLGAIVDLWSLHHVRDLRSHVMNAYER